MSTIKDLLLILATIGFTIILGGGVYEQLAVVPSWSAAPPSSLTMFQGEFGLHAEKFWGMILPLTLLLLIASLVANWKTRRRKILLIVMGYFLFTIILTGLYFVPELMSITQTPIQPTADNALTERASKWETLSILRLLGTAIASVFLLIALTKSTQNVVIATDREVPLSYPNDAMGG